TGALLGVHVQADLVGGGNRLDELIAVEQAVEPFLATLGFTGALTGAEAADEFLLFFDVGLLLFVSALLGQLGQLALLEIGGVVAGIAFEFMLGEPDDAGGELVEQIAIVAD